MLARSLLQHRSTYFLSLAAISHHSTLPSTLLQSHVTPRSFSSNQNTVSHILTTSSNQNRAHFSFPQHLLLRCQGFRTSIAHQGFGMRGEKGTQKWANHLVDSFSERERVLILDELNKLNASNSDPVTPPTTSQLKMVMIAHGLPFVGFGFLDNAIMIIAGEYIDFTLGTVLGFSTMAAAALGNMVSDLFGIGSVGYVEVLAAKIGIDVPHLTNEQMQLKSTRWFSLFGRAIGITVGCLLGMLPLLFFEKEEKKVLVNASTSTVKSSTKS